MCEFRIGQTSGPLQWTSLPVNPCWSTRSWKIPIALRPRDNSNSIHSRYASLLQEERRPAGPEGPDPAKKPVVTSMAGFELRASLNSKSRWSLKWPLLKGTSVPTSPASEPRCLLTAGNRPPSRDELPSPPRSAEAANPASPTLSPVPASLCSRHCPC